MATLSAFDLVCLGFAKSVSSWALLALHLQRQVVAGACCLSAVGMVNQLMQRGSVAVSQTYFRC